MYRDQQQNRQAVRDTRDPEMPSPVDIKQEDTAIWKLMSGPGIKRGHLQTGTRVCAKEI